MAVASHALGDEQWFTLLHSGAGLAARIRSARDETAVNDAALAAALEVVHRTPVRRAKAAAMASTHSLDVRALLLLFACCARVSG